MRGEGEGGRGDPDICRFWEGRSSSRKRGRAPGQSVCHQDRDGQAGRQAGRQAGKNTTGIRLAHLDGVRHQERNGGEVHAALRADELRGLVARS